MKAVALVSRLQHFSVDVSDIDRSIEFYREFLDMKLTERHPAYECPGIPVDLAFMRVGNSHHDFVLTHNPQKTYTTKSGLPEDDLELGNHSAFPFPTHNEEKTHQTRGERYEEEFFP